MPLYITVDIRCPECEHTWDSMEDKAELPLYWQCPACGSPEAQRTASAPPQKKLTYHEGYRRGDAFQLQKEILKLKTQRGNLPEGKREDISREINKLTQVQSTKKDKTE